MQTPGKNKPAPSSFPLRKGRYFSLTQPSPTRLVIGPRRGYWVAALLLTALAAGTLFLIASTSEFGQGAGLAGMVFLLGLPVAGILAALLLIPTFRFDIRKGQLVYGRLGRRQTLPLAQITAVEVCHGGVHHIEHEDGELVPYETYQLNLLVGGAGSRRINVSHNSDQQWVRQAGQRLAAFLAVPLRGGSNNQLL